MKIIDSDDKTIVFLNNKDTSCFDKKNIEEYFEELFLNLKNNYNFEVKGYYDIDVYKDLNYGMILEIENDDCEYYFNQIDMRVNIFKEDYFLYEVEYEYLNNNILDKFSLYKYKDKLYLKLDEIIDDIKFSKLLEYSNIIYGNKVLEIQKYSKKVKL